MRMILRLFLVAVLANVTWHAWLVSSKYFTFRHAVAAASQAGTDIPDDELRARSLDVAAESGVPLTEDGFSVRRNGFVVGEQRTVVEGSYATWLEVLPRASLPVTMPFRIATFYIRVK